MNIDEIIELFDFPGINKGNSRFDEKKLSALNAEYLRELNIESFTFLARPLLNEAGVVSEMPMRITSKPCSRFASLKHAHSILSQNSAHTSL